MGGCARLCGRCIAAGNGIEFGDSYLELISFKVRGGPKRFTFDRV
jgi:hypothetical protein